MAKSSKMQRAIGLCGSVLSWLVATFSVVIMIFTVVTVSCADKNERDIFGYKFYIVKSDSMSRSDNNAHLDVHFNAGDIVFVKTLKNTEHLKPGDVIAFVSTNADSYGETVTHMIREIKQAPDGKLLGYVTYGTNTGVNDEEIVTPDYVLGKYSFKLPGAGNFFAFVKSTAGYIVCVLVPFLLLILYNVANIIRIVRARRKEQAKLLSRQRDEIEAQRKQNEDMLRELQALRAEMTSPKQEGNEREKSDKCLFCGSLVECTVDTAVASRQFYIQGAGQLCEKCYQEIYEKEDW